MRHALIIDDDAYVRHYLRFALEQMKWRVSDAEDGLAGIELCARDLPDLVFCDLIMPTRDGIRAIREIRAAYPAANVVAMTDSVRRTSANTLKLARRYGAIAIVSKPLTESSLAAILVDVFGPTASDSP